MLHRRTVAGQSTAVLEAGPAARRLVVTAAPGALAGGEAAAAGRTAAVAKGEFALNLVTTVSQAELVVAAAVLGVAPCAATIFPKHPHEEGRDAILLKVEGTLPPRPRV